MTRLAALLLLGMALGASVRCAEQAWTTTRVAGCTVKARAYVDPSDRGASRFDIDLVQPAGGATRWDFTLDEKGVSDPQHYTNQYSAISPVPYGRAKWTTVRATLWQYDTLEERVTFRDLKLRPPADDDMAKHEPGRAATPRFLMLDSAVTATTPSGIRITLPAQKVADLTEMFMRKVGNTWVSSFHGNANALFIRIETTPDQREVILPQSPLYRKQKRPVRILLGCGKPNMMVFYRADNTYKVIAVGLPNLRTAMHLDSLTLVVRQRVELRSVPVAIRVPVFRPS